MKILTTCCEREAFFSCKARKILGSMQQLKLNKNRTPNVFPHCFIVWALIMPLHSTMRLLCLVNKIFFFFFQMASFAIAQYIWHDWVSVQLSVLPLSKSDLVMLWQATIYWIDVEETERRVRSARTSLLTKALDISILSFLYTDTKQQSYQCFWNLYKKELWLSNSTWVTS